MITIDADKQFVVREFKQYAANMRIIVKTISIETHHSIEMMKRYHDSLRRMYAIITTEIANINLEIALQMTFKVINDSIELNDLILIMLIFEAYSRMIEMNVSSSTITQRAIAMRKAIKEIQKFIATRQMNDALNTRNEFIIILIHELSLNSSLLIFRENKDNQSESWKESFKLLSIQSESAIIELSNELIKFRIILLKSYYQNDDHADNNDELSFSSTESSIELLIESSIESSVESIDEFQDNLTTMDSIVFIASVKRGRDRSRKYSALIAYLNFMLNAIISLAVSQFTASRQQKIVDLLEKEIFLSVNRAEILSDVRIFSFRFVNEIKHSNTEKTFEKFRLVIQAFNDQNKTLILIQSSIIQRISQRLIICLAVTLSMKLYLRNITQTYVQSRSNLNRDFYV